MMSDQAKSEKLTIGDLRAAAAQIAEERRHTGEIYKSPPVTSNSPGVALERGLQKLEKLSKG